MCTYVRCALFRGFALFSLFRNDVSDIADFLSHLTVKTQSEKDNFFSDLPARLHPLPPRVVAEHLLPLLLTPLIMTETVARRCVCRLQVTREEDTCTAHLTNCTPPPVREMNERERERCDCHVSYFLRRCLWKHLLTPVSSQHHRRMTFDPCRICPLFDEDLFM